MPMTQFVTFKINDEKTEFPPFGRVDTACYPASLLRKAYYVYSLPQKRRGIAGRIDSPEGWKCCLFIIDSKGCKLCC